MSATRAKAPGSRARRLHIHIGHYKTGTTALQVLCASNRAVLARHGLDYLAQGCNHAKHSRYAFSILHAEGVADRLMHGYAAPTPPETMWQELFAAVRASACRDCLISSEEFMRIGAHPAAAARLGRLLALAGDDIEIRVIAWLRAPDSHLRSWYNQLIKMGLPVPPFNRAVREVIEPIHYDYALALRPWIDALGREAITLRPFRQATPGDSWLYRDFLSLFGIDLDRVIAEDGLSLPERDPNARLDPDKLELVRLMQNAGMPPRIVTWAQKRAGEYLETEADGARAEAPDFDAIAARTARSLAELAALPGNAGVTPELFGDRLPAPEAERDPETVRLLGFVMAELRHLHMTMRKDRAAFDARLEALEKALEDLRDKSPSGRIGAE